MLDTFPVALIMGVLLGFLAGLGVGGGSLLILWLTLVLGITQDIARGINLMFFLPTAAISCVFRLRQGVLKWEIILPAVAAAVVGALLFGWLGKEIDTGLLRKPFGLLLLATGLRELFYRPRKFK